MGTHAHSGSGLEPDSHIFVMYEVFRLWPYIARKIPGESAVACTPAGIASLVIVAFEVSMIPEILDRVFGVIL